MFRYLFACSKFLLLSGLITHCLAKDAASQFDRVFNIPPEPWPFTELSETSNQINVHEGANLNRVRTDPSIELNYYGGIIETINLQGGEFNQRDGVFEGRLTWLDDSNINIHDGIFAPHHSGPQRGGAINLLGGQLRWQGFAIHDEINISGGLLRDSVLVLREATLRVSGGEIRDTRIDPGVGSTIIVTGGTLGDSDMSIDRNSRLQMDEGTSSGDLFVGGEIELNGGTVGEVVIRDDGLLIARGGTVNQRVEARADADVHLIGRNFHIRDNGAPGQPTVPIEGLVNPEDSLILPTRGSRLTLLGTYQDGTNFDFDLNATDVTLDGMDYFDSAARLRLTVAIVPEPSSLGLLIAMSVLWSFRVRRAGGSRPGAFGKRTPRD